MSRNTHLTAVESSLFEYLAGEGFALTPSAKREISARLQGHSSHEAAERYAEKAEQFFVVPLSLKDLTPNGYVLAETLSRHPVGEFSAKSEAVNLAKSVAIEINGPVLVFDGNFEHQEVVDEPLRPAPDDGFICERGLGEVLNVNALHANQEMAEDFMLEEPHLFCIREAVQCALGVSAHLRAADPTKRHLVVLHTGKERTVKWSIYE